MGAKGGGDVSKDIKRKERGEAYSFLNRGGKKSKLSGCEPEKRSFRKTQRSKSLFLQAENGSKGCSQQSEKKSDRSEDGGRGALKTKEEKPGGFQAR